MGNLSSSCLFHLTNLDNLYSILDIGFTPYPHKEAHPLFRGKTFSIPMVCFCDIPLSLISNHAEAYGKYGIGLTKDWGISQGINPVHYYTEKSSHMDHTFGLLLEISDLIITGKIDHATAERYRRYINYILSYFKTYKGKNKKGNDVTLYDEKEWRFVYPDSQAEVNNLEFNINDIKYIILNQEEEIPIFIDKISNNHYNRLPNDIDREILKSKIITIEHINSDF